MFQQKFCQGCSESHNCEAVYQRLGRAKGPSVALKVVTAFLLPAIVFIVSLAIFETVSADVMGLAGCERLRTFFDFLLAVSTTFLFVLALKAVQMRLTKNM